MIRKHTLAKNELILEKTICKAEMRRGENRESKKILEDSLSGDHREEEKVGTPKRGEGYSRTGEHKGREKSGYEKKVRKRGTLTSWRVERERYVKT
jgi:hypothetical protein